jgi:hypothetical protein
MTRSGICGAMRPARELGTSSWELLRPPGAIPQDESFRDYIDAVVDEKLARDVPPLRKKNTVGLPISLDR